MRSKGLLVDTNLLLLYIVGSLNPEKIARHKRTDKFTIEDYKLFLEERPVPSAGVVRLPEFARLGLTDSTILYLSEEGVAVLTDDLPLYLALQSRGVEVINFNHLREASWRDE